MRIKTITSAMALALLVVTAPSAFAVKKSVRSASWTASQRAQFDQQFAAYDRNGDGVITRDEFPGNAAAFNRLDRNGDGVLSAADRQGRGRGNAQQMRFRGMDRNGDGVITRDEWRGNDQSFRQHDLNGDGVLSGDEVRGRGRD